MYSHPATSSAAVELADRMRPVARQWVSQTFFGTLLKQARNSGLSAEGPLSGGRGGQAFGSLFDQHLAEGASGAAGNRLAESIVRSIAGLPRQASVEGAARGTRAQATSRLDVAG